MTSGRTADTDPILQFYRLQGTDGAGRTLAEIWTWDDERLEAVHDYIQWLFPLQQKSAFNPRAPVLTEQTTRAFHEDDTLKRHLAGSLKLMLRFYGLALVNAPDGSETVVPAPDFAVRKQQWLRAGDHNHLRLSRILASLRLLGLPEYSLALWASLSSISTEHPGVVSTTTLGHWKRAAVGS